ncbi:MAG: glycine--tRNA ligase [Tenericutes bacterium]|nr:glycine--tRNA ligase [Mycoplasmatota bacterium]
MKEKVLMEDIVNLCKQYGFVYQGSEIYGGFANTWDFGPLGVELINNVKHAWWKRFVNEDFRTYGVDAGILMNPRVWEASGHVESFGDPKMDCKKCKQRFRADNLIEEYSNGEVAAEAMSNEELEKYIDDNHITCPNCGGFDWTKIRKFNPMFKTSRGTLENDADTVYLRPETCQGEYVNFLNVQRTSRAKIPFAIAQIGKSFRNEITPGNFLFRTIEFEQMELQKFCHDKDSMEFYEDYKKRAMDFILDLGLDKEKLRYHDHDKLAHYAKAACDIQYKFPIGWEELNGIHHRGTWDLSRHSEFSGKKMEYQDPETNEKYIPTVIEYSIGVGRLTLALLCEAYDEEKLENDTRIVMRFNPVIAPYKVAVLPLVKKYHKDKAEEVFKILSKEFTCTYDDTGSIGKRYRRQDVIGTPWCITIDDNTINDNTVTIRDRDSMQQITLPIDEVAKYISDKIKF